MAVQGKTRENKEFVRELYVGLTSVKVVAVNPSREELNKLLGKEASPEDKPIVYLGSDQEGNDRLRLTFWLKEEKGDKYFVHSFNLTNKERKNKNGDKVQIINQTCGTTWVPYVMKGDEPTDKINDSLVPEWFKNFTTKDNEIKGAKKYRKALAGEEELGILLRSWLGRLDFMDPETEVMIDTKKLFKENYKELRDLISLNETFEFAADGLDTPFVILLGVREDEKDPTKKYQQIWAKGFLPVTFMKYINNGKRFPSEYTKKVWKKFTDEAVNSDYGFDAITVIDPITVFDETKVPTSGRTAQEVPEPESSDY